MLLSFLPKLVLEVINSKKALAPTVVPSALFLAGSKFINLLATLRMFKSPCAPDEDFDLMYCWINGCNLGPFPWSLNILSKTLGL